MQFDFSAFPFNHECLQLLNLLRWPYFIILFPDYEAPLHRCYWNRSCRPCNRLCNQPLQRVPISNINTTISLSLRCLQLYTRCHYRQQLLHQNWAASTFTSDETNLWLNLLTSLSELGSLSSADFYHPWILSENKSVTHSLLTFPAVSYHPLKTSDFSTPPATQHLK